MLPRHDKAAPIGGKLSLLGFVNTGHGVHWSFACGGRQRGGVSAEQHDVADRNPWLIKRSVSGRNDAQRSKQERWIFHRQRALDGVHFLGGANEIAFHRLQFGAHWRKVEDLLRDKAAGFKGSQPFSQRGVRTERRFRNACAHFAILDVDHVRVFVRVTTEEKVKVSEVRSLTADLARTGDELHLLVGKAAKALQAAVREHSNAVERREIHLLRKWEIVSAHRSARQQRDYCKQQHGTAGG